MLILNASLQPAESNSASGALRHAQGSATRSACHVVVLFLALFASLSANETVSVAAAANLTFALKPLDAAFEAANPLTQVTTTFAASGNLVAMIARGAPYDVFLSADLEFPRKLIEEGGADKSTLTPFANGKLVLWTLRPGLPLDSIASVVRNPAVQKLAIANPESAPYGRAAQETLAKLGLAEAARPKLVTGENISQTAQYVSSGNADAGFVALSLVLAPNLTDRGRWLEVPPTLYAPLTQGAVLTRRGSGSPAARRYLAFLTSPAARTIFARFGYVSP